MESEVNDALVQHVFKDNNLVSDRQWAYRAGYSTELLLVHLTEEWRKLLDSGKFVAVACIDFRKTFDIVSHEILEKKLKRDFGITGTLFDWLKSYLSERRQFTVLNRGCIRNSASSCRHSPGFCVRTNTVHLVY